MTGDPVVAAMSAVTMFGAVSTAADQLGASESPAELARLWGRMLAHLASELAAANRSDLWYSALNATVQTYRSETSEVA